MNWHPFLTVKIEKENNLRQNYKLTRLAISPRIRRCMRSKNFCFEDFSFLRLEAAEFIFPGYSKRMCRFALKFLIKRMLAAVRSPRPWLLVTPALSSARTRLILPVSYATLYSYIEHKAMKACNMPTRNSAPIRLNNHAKLTWVQLKTFFLSQGPRLQSHLVSVNCGIFRWWD